MDTSSILAIILLVLSAIFVFGGRYRAQKQYEEQKSSYSSKDPLHKKTEPRPADLESKETSPFTKLFYAAVLTLVLLTVLRACGALG